MRRQHASKKKRGNIIGKLLALLTTHSSLQHHRLARDVPHNQKHNCTHDYTHADTHCTRTNAQALTPRDTNMCTRTRLIRLTDTTTKPHTQTHQTHTAAHRTTQTSMTKKSNTCCVVCAPCLTSMCVRRRKEDNKTSEPSPIQPKVTSTSVLRTNAPEKCFNCQVSNKSQHHLFGGKCVCRTPSNKAQR